MTIQFNLEKRQIVKGLAKVLVYFSGIAILIWQVHGTFETFFKNRTSFSIREETFDSLVPPTLVFCSRNQKPGSYKNWFTNMSNKDQFNEEFFWLNEHFYLNISKYIHIGIFGFKTCIFFSSAVIASTNLSDLFSDPT